MTVTPEPVAPLVTVASRLADERIRCHALRMTSNHAANDHGPGVHVPPPLFFVAGFAIGALVHRFVAIPAPWGAIRAVTRTGTVLVMLGIACMCTGALTFLLAKTTVMPHRPASALVTHGIYAYTRNPMYLGFTTAYVGAALAAGLVMPLVLLPPVLLLLTVFVIRREERYLRDTFPATFDAYASRVRRWL